METTRDFAMRMAAAEHVRRIAISDVLSSEQLAGGFVFAGERVPLVNPQRGIFKPRSMEHLLSIRTVFPRSGARVEALGGGLGRQVVSPWKCPHR